ncbi:hypothetical protein [Bradyrhizobium sp. CCBAU 51765]|uniref:hypothetical protein n=1 Tax=Bradyrhizobium sp. CCBAU 51765 TaxID=1325102 RepID=UPI001887F4B7|nr:hypothetical protein [Bradyrhizobium sp. CCBAU 51765]
MTEADRVRSTPPLNSSSNNVARATTIDPVETSSRRRFLAQAAAVTAGGVALGPALPLPGSAAAAGLTSNPILEAVTGAPLQAPTLTLDSSLASDELRSACRKVDDTHETLKAAWTEYQRVQELGRDWNRQHPAPDGSRRAYRKWERRWCKHRDEVNFDGAQAAYFEARTDFEKAKVAVALVDARDLNELALKAAVAYVYEDPRERHLRNLTPTIAASVAVGLAIMVARAKGASA